MALPERPRPRALVVGITPDSPFGRTIDATCPTTQFVSHYSEVRLEDFDVLIVQGDQFNGFFPGGPRVLWFSDTGSVSLGLVRSVETTTMASAGWRSGGRAAEFQRGPAATAAAAHDLADTLAPESSDYNVFTTSSSDLTDGTLLREKGGAEGVVAAIVRHNNAGAGEIWCLPARAIDRAEDWFRVAITRWKTLDPTAFPEIDWAAQPEWMDADQRASLQQLTDHDQHAADLLDALAQQREPLAARFETATAVAKAGALRLLTAQGSELVDAVSDALRLLGFTVTDSDQERPAEKFEDLQVGDAGWIAVAEVKGYARRNARSSDFYQIANAVTAYVLREGAKPSARWYVINHAFETPPPLRSRPLHSNPEAIAIFARDNGLVIDTRDLFRLSVEVQRGHLPVASAREMLKSSTGVFTYPAPDETAYA